MGKKLNKEKIKRLKSLYNFLGEHPSCCQSMPQDLFLWTLETLDPDIEKEFKESAKIF